jgi:NTP pyrophosphatase (non-canonical NTP hydrolase)
MEPKIKEILDILKEECGELVVAASKCTRWGLDSSWQDRSNLQNLTQEAGDVMCMIELLVAHGVLDKEELLQAGVAKLGKLRKWSTIFNDDAP